MKTSQTHYLSFFGFLLFAVAALLAFIVSFFLALSVLITYMGEGTIDVQSLIYTATIGFTGVLLGTVSAISLLRFMDKPAAYKSISTNFEVWKIVASVTGAGLALFIGYLVQENQSVNWLLLPLLTIPAVILPIWTLVRLGMKDLPIGTRWRTWGAFGISLTVTPLSLFILETLILVMGIIIAILYVVLNPDLATELERLTTQFAFMDMQSEEGLRLLMPYLMKPAVVISVTVFISMIIPLIEELLKPLAVWFLAGKLDSPAQGFAFGALSGAGFAIWETFNVSGQTAEWSAVLFTRIGTGLLHVTTSALMGGAIFMAIREKRYLRLLGTYLLVVFLHGLWNALAVASTFSSLAVTYIQANNLEPLQWISMIGLAALAVVLLTILVISNRKLRAVVPVSSPTDEVPPIQNDTNV